jgi:hypothetical protein
VEEQENMNKSMMAALLGCALIWVAGCRSAAEFMGFTGKPEGNSGWSHDYNATPQDVYEAFRVIVRDNGQIENEVPEELHVEGLYIRDGRTPRTGITVRGTVYDHSTDDEVRSRLIVHAWYSRAAGDRERQELARDYCNSVFHLLRDWQGEPRKDDSALTTTSDEPIAEDEAVGYFRVTQEQAMEVSRHIVELYGVVDQADAGFLRGTKQNPLEPNAQEVRLWVYDRTEQDRVRVKLSVRVRSHDNQPLQDVARAYVGEIRKELERRYLQDE